MIKHYGRWRERSIISRLLFQTDKITDASREKKQELDLEGWMKISLANGKQADMTGR